MACGRTTPDNVQMAVLPRGYVDTPSLLPASATPETRIFRGSGSHPGARHPRPFAAERKLGTLRSLWPTLLSPM